MSEYWVSQGRKMCTYCKCWTADNKASINFHEQGKNHKENVKRKLDELRKKGLEDARKRDAETSELEKIEKAAFESLKKDMLDNQGISNAYGLPKDTISKLSKSVVKADSNQSKNNSQSTGSSSASNSDVWSTAHTEDGHLYYWNTLTNETSWYPPEGMSESDGKDVNKAEPDATTSVATEDEPTIVQPLEPANNYRPTAYGQWETIRSDVAEISDYDLPTDSKNMATAPEDIPLPPSEIVEEISEQKAEDTETRNKFKVKRVSLGSSSKDDAPVAFKKSKFGKKRQMRGNLDD